MKNKGLIGAGLLLLVAAAIFIIWYINSKKKKAALPEASNEPAKTPAAGGSGNSSGGLVRSEPKPSNLFPLVVSDQGTLVSELQRLLATANNNPTDLKVDGKFGPITLRYVRSMFGTDTVSEAQFNRLKSAGAKTSVLMQVPKTAVEWAKEMNFYQKVI